MRTKQKFTYILAILVALTGALSAQTSEILFDHYTRNQGLSQNTIYALFQDHLGFLWIGTGDGLCRFDGYTFKNFRMSSSDSNSLSNNGVFALCEDKDGIIWIGTRGGGLNRYDPRTERFSVFQNDAGDSTSLSHNIVSAILEDDHGNLWVGTNGGGLNCLNRTTGKFIRFDRNNSASQLLHMTIRTIYDDHNGSLWIGTDGGLNRIENRSTLSSTEAVKQLKWGSYRIGSVSSIFQDNRKDYWLALSDQGLVRFDPAKKDLNSFEFVLTHNHVLTAGRDSMGNILVGTHGDGLFRLHPFTKSIDVFINNPSDSRSLSSNTVGCLLTDQHGIVWIGTYGGSLNKHDPHAKAFFSYMQNSGDPKSLSGKNIWSVYEDRDSTVWVGTDSEGLNKFNRKTRTFTVYTHNEHDRASLSSNRIYSILEDRERNFWVGTSEGVDRLDRKTGRAVKYLPGKILSIFQDSDGWLWAGTGDSGLYRFSMNKKGLLHFSQNRQRTDALSQNTIYAIVEDHHHTLWFGTGEGLNRYNKLTNSFTVYHPGEEKGKPLSARIYTILPDSSGCLWLGTNAGLQYFDPIRKKTVVYHEEDGLANNIVYAIRKDRQGDLWMSTNCGLSRFDPRTKRFQNFTANDGLQDNEFNSGASHLGPSGRMYFGGTNGYSEFFPERITRADYTAPIILTGFSIFNKPVQLDTSITYRTSLTLSYRDNFFSLAYAALHFTNPEKIRYRYKMEGFDSDWRDDRGAKREATYTNLAGGEYLFRVQAANSDGVWNKEEASIRITVTPPFWKTIWFYGAASGSLLLLLIVAYKMRVRRIEKYSRELEELVKVKTTDLTDANNRLEESNREILSQKEELGKMLNDLREASAKIKTLDGLLPICASCKKIRDDTGYWNQLERYITDHSEAKLSHGICPDCAEKLYPGFAKKKAAKNDNTTDTRSEQG